MTRLRVGLSTCPNDTFLFGPLLEGRVDCRGLDLDLHLADVEELNQALTAGSLDVSKASFATALELSDDFGVLRVGSALGYGVGPVLLGPPGASLPTATSKVLCPGAGTTATLLMKCLFPEVVHLEQTRFDRIMPALLEGQADAGVCIHEGRFSYREQGLELLDDLGQRWEASTGTPVPLGGLLARIALGNDVHKALTAVFSESLAIARADVPSTLPTMRKWAQELDDDVLLKHVELYV
ncbi:MAG: 1,4-dihydroxy-6-naphthoate synthase, partial [Pseudohongiellaceae bacterium]